MIVSENISKKKYCKVKNYWYGCKIFKFNYETVI